MSVTGGGRSGTVTAGSLLHVPHAGSRTSQGTWGPLFSLGMGREPRGAIFLLLALLAPHPGMRSASRLCVGRRAVTAGGYGARPSPRLARKHYTSGAVVTGRPFQALSWSWLLDRAGFGPHFECVLGGLPVPVWLRESSPPVPRRLRAEGPCGVPV